MTAERLEPEDLPDSANAHALRRAPKNLRFEAPLEEAYRALHLRRVRPRVRLWHSVCLALAVLFTLLQWRRAGPGTSICAALLGAQIPCAAALVWLAWSRRYERLYLPMARLLVAIYHTLFAVFAALALSLGGDEPLAILAVLLVGVFFFNGLMFREALSIGTAMVIAFAAAAVAANLAAPLLANSLALIALAGGTAAVVYRDVERSYRKNFLDAALIADLVARDALSGLMNRRAFDEYLARAWAQALREQRPLSLLMIDIDHLKQYNDRWGHEAGDTALCGVSAVIQGIARRPLDLAARFGGDQFGVILYDLSYPHIEDVAERLRLAVQSLNLGANDPGAYRNTVTVSVGVGVAVPSPDREPQGAIQLANEALNAAKLAGRNCVVIKGVEAYALLDTGAFRGTRKVRRLRERVE